MTASCGISDPLQRSRQRVRLAVLWLLTVAVTATLPLGPYYLGRHGTEVVRIDSSKPMQAPSGMPDPHHEDQNSGHCLRCVIPIAEVPAVTDAVALDLPATPYLRRPYQVPHLAVPHDSAEARAPPLPISFA